MHSYDALETTSKCLASVQVATCIRPEGLRYTLQAKDIVTKAEIKTKAFEGAGSITILAATTMPGDDVTHPVPDNTGYITEGQLYLKHGRIEPFGSLNRLKQLVNNQTREDHRTIMDSMVQLYAAYRESMEKQSMGFHMSEWDNKLLKYGKRFESEMMDLNVNIPLEAALYLGWKILADCFEKAETGITSKFIEKFCPAS